MVTSLAPLRRRRGRRWRWRLSDPSIGSRVDLLVTDLGLPRGLNGRQVADAARELRPGLKVLFITGYAENAVLSHGHLDPGMYILTKPFAIDGLAERMRGLIEG